MLQRPTILTEPSRMRSRTDFNTSCRGGHVVICQWQYLCKTGITAGWRMLSERPEFEIAAELRHFSALQAARGCFLQSARTTARHPDTCGKR
jgi:hypothetical protein